MCVCVHVMQICTCPSCVCVCVCVCVCRFPPVHPNCAQYHKGVCVRVCVCSCVRSFTHHCLFTRQQKDNGRCVSVSTCRTQQSPRFSAGECHRCRDTTIITRAPAPPESAPFSPLHYSTFDHQFRLMGAPRDADVPSPCLRMRFRVCFSRCSFPVPLC